MAIKTIKASGGDFATLTAWLNSLPATLTEPEIAELDAFDLVDQILINKTTSAANYIEIRPASGLQTTGVFGVTKARIRNGGAGTNAPIRLSSLHVRIHGIQMYQETATVAGVGPLVVTASGAGSDVRIYDCLMRDAQSTSTLYSINTAVANLNLTFYNNVVYGAVRSMDARGMASGKIFNCIFWRTSAQLGLLADSNCEVRNSYSGSSVPGADCFWSGGTPTGSNNISSDTTALTKFPTGSVNNVAGATAFMSVTPGSEDFRHASASTPLVNAGTTIASVTNDIRGVTRPQGGSYDVGAFEYTSSTPATDVTFTGPTSGTVGTASSNFTVGANGSITGTLTITPSDGGGGGTFTPATVNISDSSATATFTYTPSSTGTKTLSVSNNGGLTNPASISYAVSAAAATAVTMTGPSGGQVGAASANFTIGANGAITGNVVVTPSDGGGGGSFNPASVTISAAQPTATFKYTPASSGNKTISVANDGGLTNPATITYGATATAATLTISGIRNGSKTLLANATFPVVSVVQSSNGSALLTELNKVSTNGGDLVFSSAQLTAGVPCTVVAFDPAAKIGGIWFGTPV